ncbi:putative cell division protein FtsW [Pseudoramibacter alactolyticus ATCC 23263]|uniref:Probable peptidoglycan glycosyltransferase FtsW n=1 Tax=Pseudoramibacter alactolyticus ATCC 23263 TaxID=887929 RepID=E6MGC7_9FIRM|nr:putative peptidoglycan glycosyltransferase FtsW [Pseudoramibacter alactolyticus]EFV01667.1 putative cell division protein FtsW [Pseudoramibacter alactolyticus ATCC 23263]
MGSRQPDKYFVTALLILSGFGLLMVFSASMYTSSVESSNGLSLFLKQAFFVVLGIFVMWLVSRKNYRRWNNFRLACTLLIVTILLLAAVLVVGMEVNGAKRWISLGFMTFQPSEFAKFTGVLYLSTVISQKPEVKKRFSKYTLYCIVPMLVICVLAAIEPSLSAAMAIGVAMLFVMFFGGIPFRFFLPYIAVMGAGIGALLIKEPWRMERLNVFFGQNGLNYQISQSLLAIGSGGIFGRGLGNGKQKLLFLPELQNDFIFANIGEECGLIGCVLLLVLFGYILYRGFKIANSSKDEFGYLYTSSVIALLGFQVIVNIGVATSIMPVTGMALPFISAGGTSMVILFMMVGPIVNLSRGMHSGKRRRSGRQRTKRGQK